MVTVSQLKGRLAELLEIPKKQTDEILWALEQVVVETVKSGDSITLPGIAKIECRVTASRKGRNPATGESLQIPAKVAVKAKAVPGLESSAPSLKSKKGKALLDEAEKKKAKREKLRRQREREAENNGKPKATKTKKSSGKKKTKVKGRY